MTSQAILDAENAIWNANGGQAAAQARARAPTAEEHAAAIGTIPNAALTSRTPPNWLDRVFDPYGVRAAINTPEGAQASRDANTIHWNNPFTWITRVTAIGLGVALIVTGLILSKGQAVAVVQKIAKGE